MPKITKHFNDKILRSQLAALHDITHNRTPRGENSYEFTRPYPICPICQTNTLRKERIQAEFRKNQAMPPDQRPDLSPGRPEKCPIHTLSELMVRISPATRKPVAVEDDHSLSCYIPTKKHHGLDLDVLSEQLELACRDLKENDICDGWCPACPMTAIRYLMEISTVSGQFSVPVHEHNLDMPRYIRRNLTLTHYGRTIDAELLLRLPEKRSALSAQPIVDAWAAKFLKSGRDTNNAKTTIRPSSRQETPHNYILLDCTGINNKRFKLEIPVPDPDPNVAIKDYILDIINTWFQNITSFAPGKPIETDHSDQART